MSLFSYTVPSVPILFCPLSCFSSSFIYFLLSVYFISPLLNVPVCLSFLSLSLSVCLYSVTLFPLSLFLFLFLFYLSFCYLFILSLPPPRCSSVPLSYSASFSIYSHTSSRRPDCDPVWKEGASVGTKNIYYLTKWVSYVVSAFTFLLFPLLFTPTQPKELLFLLTHFRTFIPFKT